MSSSSLYELLTSIYIECDRALRSTASSSASSSSSSSSSSSGLLERANVEPKQQSPESPESPEQGNTTAEIEFKSGADQVKHILSDDRLPFDQWYSEQFVPTFRAARDARRKSIEEARRHKTLADVYKAALSINNATTSEAELSQNSKEFLRKAFESINKAIIWAPIEPRSYFLFECFTQRANLHFAANDWLAALHDLDYAIHFNPASLTAIDRKIAVLRKLGRAADAYRYVTELLLDRSKKSINGDASVHRLIGQLKKWKKELKQYDDDDDDDEDRRGDDNEEKVEKENSDEESKLHYIEIDKRIGAKRNTFNKRINLIATDDIASGTDVLIEQPMIFDVISVGSHCAGCARACRNTFWPCADCVDAIFCSRNCAMISGDDQHRAECGMLRAIRNSQFESQALQAYRHLATIGWREMIKIDAEAGSKKKAKFLSKKLIAEIRASSCDDDDDDEGGGGDTGRRRSLHDRDRVRALFARTQAEIRYWFETKKPLRTCSELSNAILLVAIYRFKVIDGDGDNDRDDKGRQSSMTLESIVELVRIIATELAKIGITEYGWHREKGENEDEEGEEEAGEDDDKGGEDGDAERCLTQIGNFQCLIGSRVTHSCEPNATWMFDSARRRFILSTARSISRGETITISYIADHVTLDEMTLAARQCYLRDNFAVMCACVRCVREATAATPRIATPTTLRLRCIACNGTVPYDENDFVNHRCMWCERDNVDYANRTRMRKIAREYRSTRACIALLRASATTSTIITDNECNNNDESDESDDDDKHREQIAQIERQMSNFSMLIDLRNREFLAMIRDLCVVHIGRRDYDAAIGWYQWLADGIGIRLCAIDDQGEDDEEDDDDPFAHFAALRQWSIVYHEFIVEKIMKRRRRRFNNRHRRCNISGGDMKQHWKLRKSNQKSSLSSSLSPVSSSFSYSGAKITKYIATASQIYERMFAAIELLNMNGRKVCETIGGGAGDGDGEDSIIISLFDYEKIIESLRSSASERFERFRAICDCFAAIEVKQQQQQQKQQRNKNNKNNKKGKKGKIRSTLRRQRSIKTKIGGH